MMTAGPRQPAGRGQGGRPRNHIFSLVRRYLHELAEILGLPPPEVPGAAPASDRRAVRQAPRRPRRLARRPELPPPDAPHFAPAGGAHLFGVFYQGGERIPASVVPSLPRHVRARMVFDPARAAGIFAGRAAAPAPPEDPARARARLPHDVRPLFDYGVEYRPPAAPFVEALRQATRRHKGIDVGRRRKGESEADYAGRMRRLLPPEAGHHLRDDELLRLLPRHVDVLASVLARVPPLQQWAAAARAGRVKRGWYALAADALAETFGPEAPRFAALLAATSPRTDVHANFRKALRVWRWYQDHLARAADPRTGQTYARSGTRPRPEEVRAAIDAARSSGEWQGVLGGIPDFTLHDRAIARALGEADPAPAGFGSLYPGGYKIDSFRRNLQRNLDAVANDVWVAAFADVDPNLVGRLPVYLAFNAQARRAAAELNRNLPRGSRPWSPAEVQETVWSFFRTLAYVGGKTRTAGHPLAAEFGGPAGGEDVLRGLRHGHVAHTADFLDLMATDPEVQREIRSLGPEFAAGLERVVAGYAQNPPPWKAGRLRQRSRRVEARYLELLADAARRSGRHVGAFVGGRLRAQRQGISRLRTGVPR